MKHKFLCTIYIVMLLLLPISRVDAKGVGKYDNKDLGWVYYGNWTQSQPISGPYLDTIHYSTSVGNAAEIAVDGSQIIIVYSKYYNRGILSVYIDGQLETNIDQYRATRMWQTSWVSGNLGSGEHIIRLEHNSGSIVDVDAIEIKTYAPPLPQQVIPNGTPIYLFAPCQSNCSGRGTEYPDPMPYDSSAWMFGDDYKFCLVREPADLGCGGNYVDEINWDSNAGLGPTLDFSLKMRELNPSQAIVVINCSKGSTYLDQWLPSRNENTLMGACLRRTYAALTSIENGYVAGVLVSQGESDAGERLRAYAWRDNFETIVNYMRAEFGDVPFVIAQLGNHADDADKPFWSVVQAQQLLASQTISNTGMFITSDLEVQADKIHKTTPAYRIEGQRYAIFMCELLNC